MAIPATLSPLPGSRAGRAALVTADLQQRVRIQESSAGRADKAIPWTDATLGAGVSNQGSGHPNAGSYGDGRGRIWLRGSVVTSGGSPVTLFTLPAGGYQPPSLNEFTVASYVNATTAIVGIIQIATNGNVTLIAGGTAGQAWSLDGINFRNV